jgi:hypothetical protein
VRRLVLVWLTVAALAVALADAQDVPRRLGGSNGPTPTAAEANRPAPRLADGTTDLSGVWTGGGGEEITRLLKPAELDAILLPHTKKLLQSRNDGMDPYNYCLPGGPLRITGGFAWRLVQHPTVNAKYIFMLQEGNAHTYRQIFMDGRKHPDDPSPTWYGHSTGHWKVRRWSSIRSGSTTGSGWMPAVSSTPSSCTSWSAGRAPTTRQ